MAVEASRWLSYGEAAERLGLSLGATKRLALRRGWPRRSTAADDTLVAVPEAMLDGLQGEAEPAEVDRAEACTLLAYLQAHVERLTEELAEARTEMRGVRYEAESLRVEAGRAQVLAALVEAERARSAEIRAERDRLAAELMECRRPWPARVLWALMDCRPARRRAF